MKRKARKKKARRRSQPYAIPRALLGREVQRRIDALGLSRDGAAKVVRDAASQMSRLMTGHFEDFSSDRLVMFLTRLGSDVDIVVRHGGNRRRRGKVDIKTARGRG